ncbi:MAG: TIGR03960 family B12-binding radical SAM protein [Candidatus Xenobia bacterium]
MSPSLSERYEALLTRVNRPARYAGGETGQVVKDPSQVGCHICLVFPDLYEIGMSNYGIAILYHLLNEKTDSYCERAYAVAPDLEALLRAEGIPLLSLESRTPLKAFDMVGFGLQSELTYINVLQILDLSGIALRSVDREEDDPIVIAGGHGAFNPEPMAPFIDAFVIGDGEDAIVAVRDCVAAHRDRPRMEQLRALSEVPAVYVPLLYHETEQDGWIVPVGKPVLKAAVENLDTTFFPTTQIIPWTETVHDRIAIEVMRGCTQGCRFCQAGMITRPIRERSPETVVRLASELVANTGLEEVSLLSLSTADHRGVIPMAEGVLKAVGGPCNVNISLPSSRADAFNVQLATMVGGQRKSGVTLAPEAGSERLRKAISKFLTRDEILNACRSAAQGGHPHVKLYFMVGLPTETDEDLHELVELVLACEKAGQEVRPRFAVHIGLSGLVPKPHTPFQWVEQVVEDELRRRYLLVKRALPGRIKVTWGGAEERFVEGILSRADRRMADVIERTYRMGARFDAWKEYVRVDLWKRAADELGVDLARYLSTRQVDSPLPWSHIETGISDRYMKSEWKKTLDGRDQRDCREACTACNACDRLGIEMRFGGQVGVPNSDKVHAAFVRQQRTGVST